MIDQLLFPTILSLSIQGVIGIISQIQHSRCSEIRAGCISCKREVPAEQPRPPQIEEVEARPSNI